MDLINSDLNRITHSTQQQHQWPVANFYGIILLLLLLDFPWITSANITVLDDQDCGDLECLKCNAIGCVKCQNLIKYDDRQCVSECPRGYIEQWSSVPELMGRVCRTNGYSDPMIATIVGLSIGSIICVVMLVLSIIIIRKKRKSSKSMRNSIMNDVIDLDEFHRQLDELRPNAQYFLAMLNDTRCQIRKLYLSGDHSGANSYRTVVRDLAKLLILLNRPVQLVKRPPRDWPRLYVWAHRLLEHCKPELVQLIDFLQVPSMDVADCRLGSSQYSTFKSTNTMNTAISGGVSGGGGESKNLHQMQLFGSLISLHEIDEPRTSNPISRSSCSTLKSNYHSSDLHGSSMWLEDEFFKLGLRPQDEITTEL